MGYIVLVLVAYKHLCGQRCHSNLPVICDKGLSPCCMWFNSECCIFSLELAAMKGPNLASAALDRIN